MTTKFALVLLAVCSIGFVEISRRGEQAVVDEALGRPVFLLALWGIALSAAVTLLASPASVWRPSFGSLGVATFSILAAAWCVVVLVVGLFVEYVPSPTPEKLLGSLIGWVLVEEFLFRGALFDLTRRAFPQWGGTGAVVVTAVLFALSHLQYHAFDMRASAVQIAYVVPTGLLFGFVRLHTGSVWAPVILHCLANGLSNAEMRVQSRRRLRT